MKTPLIEKPPFYVSVLVVAYVLAGFLYFGWRFTTINWQLPLFSIALYVAELFGFVTGLLYALMTYRLAVRVPEQPLSNASVDVFVPTYNESVELVRRTLLAARNIEYPHKTWLLDDGNRIEMRELAAELGCDYLARGENAHAKAGNLNHALKHSSGEFIAIFDADHAARKDFLTKVIGFFADPRVGFVQTPQDFYNVDSFSHRQIGRRVWHEQSLFFKVIQRGKDSWNAAFFCGSCAVLRRSALERIGGFATETVTEDIHTSILLHKAGYKSVYYPESLAFGLAPHSLDTYLQQRIRWGVGGMQVLRRERVLWSSGLTLAQRLNYMASMLIYFEGWQKFVFFVTPPIVFFFGLLPIVAPMGQFLGWFFLYYLLSMAMYLELARGYGALLLSEQYGMSRFFAFMSTTTGLFRKRTKFSVTSKELSLAGKAWLWLSPSLMVAAVTLLSIPVGIYRIWDGSLPVGAGIANAVWALTTIATATVVAWFSHRRARNRRAEYRFPVHVPITLKLGHSECLGFTEDLSAAGALYKGAVLHDISQQSSVDVVVHLPNLVVPVPATVTFIWREGMKPGDQPALGLRFNWPNAQASAPLERFLFGSSLQFDLGQMTDQRPTFLARLSGQAAYADNTRGGDPRWSAARIDAGNPGQAVPVVIADDAHNGGILIISNCSLMESTESVELQTLDGAGIDRRQVHLSPDGTLETPTGPMYLYNATAAANA
ncbi:glycosyltransferase [Paraburkholderia phymatum]|uniref:Cellulose synthase (UDP-forming) n=1 Tax=Paraburkholderia phymatum (strain DSM 17167 / CIP 108236 / LMG 21445 / STM815) TaxID=391038 RepID=B2JFS7_PARP8|nr:glycosyltransferase [Paraburkholderia phymatum]ACC71552.1 Cellulose synthase (UDP-forming) [Paraburkholderia phymatum STM815]